MLPIWTTPWFGMNWTFQYVSKFFLCVFNCWEKNEIRSCGHTRRNDDFETITRWWWTRRRSIGPNLPSVQLSIQMRWAVLSPGQSHEHPQFMTNSSVNSIVDVVPQRKLYFGRVCFLSSQFRIMGVVLLVVLIRYKTYLRQSCSPHISNSCLFLNACRVPALSCI
jgi:hypothetical protein